MLICPLKRKELKKKKILPKPPNFVIRTKHLFSELQSLIVAVAFIVRLDNN